MSNVQGEYSTSIKSILATLLALRRVAAEHLNEKSTIVSTDRSRINPLRQTGRIAYLAKTYVLSLSFLTRFFHGRDSILDSSVVPNVVSHVYPRRYRRETNVSFEIRTTIHASGVNPRRPIEASIACAAYSGDAVGQEEVRKSISQGLELELGATYRQS